MPTPRSSQPIPMSMTTREQLQSEKIKTVPPLLLRFFDSFSAQLKSLSWSRPSPAREIKVEKNRLLKKIKKIFRLIFKECGARSECC